MSSAVESSPAAVGKASSSSGAILQALFVTFLWSTSWVLTKIGLRNVPPVLFAGLRYTLAFLCLAPFALRGNHRLALRSLARKNWGRLILLGFLLYAVTQGAVYAGLALLPAVTVSLLLNFTSVIVAFLGMGWLGEKLKPLHWAGFAINLAGIIIYFYPAVLPHQQALGLAIVAVGVLANGVAVVLGRSINRHQAISPLIVTLISMGVGAFFLLVSGLAISGLPAISPTSWAIIVWLAVVNTAFAFTLWNHTLRRLTAMQSNMINSTMLIQTAVLAGIFLGEAISLQAGIGLALAALGVLFVQLRR
jgi:drug/metabolite transporter (DMT)-like permease